MLERARNAPVITFWCALFLSDAISQAHRQLKHYEGKTWIWPRAMWALALLCLVLLSYESASDFPASPATLEENLEIVATYAIWPVILCFFHFYVTFLRFFEAIVWCRVVETNYKTGAVEATLLVPVYRLPFLDPARTAISPWERKIGTYWGQNTMVVNLETNRDINSLRIVDIYDESVCWVRQPTLIPATAKHYEMHRTSASGDSFVRRVKSPKPELRVSIWTLIVTALGIAVATALSVYSIASPHT